MGADGRLNLKAFDRCLKRAEKNARTRGMNDMSFRIQAEAHLEVAELNRKPSHSLGARRRALMNVPYLDCASSSTCSSKLSKKGPVASLLECGNWSVLDRSKTHDSS